MERIFENFILENPESFENSLFHWLQSFETTSFYTSNSKFNYNDKYSSYDLIASCGAVDKIQVSNNCFPQLSTFIKEKNDWVFGYLTYDLKNELEDLISENVDGTGFPQLYFFQPEIVFLLNSNKLSIGYFAQKDLNSAIEILKSVLLTDVTNQNAEESNIELKSRISEKEYLDKIIKLKEHIQQGDIYEVNFCMEYFSENAILNPYHLFRKLNKLSKAPFAGFLKLSDKFILCSSPERYLQKKSNHIISQPIKGTIKRGITEEDDEKLKLALQNSSKEKSENVMIVDLVRNDLSRIAAKGSVNVDELFGVYTFKQVHQLISTISADIKEEADPIDIIKSTFPMGSMTGAPKIKAMEIIEKYEVSKRGVYSGAMGYFSPVGDFDFNVVIRSILYNQTRKYISYSVGSAITANSDPKQEYDECLLKGKALREVLTSV